MSFLDEIKQQPEALLHLIRRYEAGDGVDLELPDIIKERNINEFVFTGMGSSTFVGHVVTTMLSRHGIKARTYETKEFMTGGVKTLGDDTMLFLISQSGECKEILEFCQGQLASQRNVAVITNNTDKSLYQYGESKFLLHAGEELFTSTKTYTNTVASVLYIGNLILQSKGIMPYDFGALARACAKVMQDVVDAYSQQMTEFFADAGFICFVGGGASYSTACQAEVIVEEAAKIYASRYLPAQFLHGPVELIDEKYNAIAFDFSDDTREEIDRIIDNIVSYGGKICVITNRDISANHPNLLSIKLPVENELYAPLVEIVPVEIFVNSTGLKRGLTPGVLTRVRK